jgi:hypothetical protein
MLISPFAACLYGDRLSKRKAGMLVVALALGAASLVPPAKATASCSLQCSMD